MEDARSIGEVRAWRRRQRESGRRVALVATMGALHDGHMALVRAARGLADCVVLTVFVNPTQFGPGDDFEAYPRNLARDRALASEAGVDLIFAPSADVMYPEGASTTVQPGDAALRWEGEARPGHFAGVLTIVCKLFNIVEPDVACFGQKDVQQVAVIRQMIDDLNIDVRLDMVPTVREPDGLALSSRNVYLSADERARARAISAALQAAADAAAAGERRAPVLTGLVRDGLRESGIEAEYIAIVEPDRLTPVERADQGTVIALAAYVGTTRLIDNVILGSES